MKKLGSLLLLMTMMLTLMVGCGTTTKDNVNGTGSTNDTVSDNGTTTDNTTKDNTLTDQDGDGIVGDEGTDTDRIDQSANSSKDVTDKVVDNSKGGETVNGNTTTDNSTTNNTTTDNNTTTKDNQ